MATRGTHLSFFPSSHHPQSAILSSLPSLSNHRLGSVGRASCLRKTHQGCHDRRRALKSPMEQLEVTARKKARKSRHPIRPWLLQGSFKAYSRFRTACPFRAVPSGSQALGGGSEPAVIFQGAPGREPEALERVLRKALATVAPWHAHKLADFCRGEAPQRFTLKQAPVSAHSLLSSSCGHKIAGLPGQPRGCARGGGTRPGPPRLQGSPIPSPSPSASSPAPSPSSCPSWATWPPPTKPAASPGPGARTRRIRRPPSRRAGRRRSRFQRTAPVLEPRVGPRVRDLSVFRESG